MVLVASRPWIVGLWRRLFSRFSPVTHSRGPTPQHTR